MRNISSKPVLHIISRFLAIMPVVILFLFMYEQLVILQRSHVRELQSQEQSEDLRMLDYMVNGIFEEYHATLLLMRNANEFTDYLKDPSQQNLKQVAGLFERISRNRPYLLRITLTDAFGLEKLKMLASEGSTRILESPDLMAIADSNSFSHTRELSANEVYFTDLAPLFTENTYGEDQNTVFRVCIPVYQVGIFQGVLIITCDSRHVLGVFDRYLVHKAPLVSYGVFDGRGALIYGPGLHGAAVVSSQMEIFIGEISGLWEQIQAQPAGTYFQHGVNYNFQSINPLHIPARQYETQKNYWIVATSFSDSEMPVLSNNFFLRNPWLKWVLAIIILILGGIINALTYVRKNDREMLAVGDLIAEYSHDGVVISDPSLQIQYANHVFETMFDYTRDSSIDGKRLFHPLDGESLGESKKGLLWIEGRKRQYILSRFFFKMIFNERGYAIYSVGIFSSPKFNTRESFDEVVQDLLEGSAADIAVLPLQLIGERLSSAVPFSLLYVQLDSSYVHDTGFSQADQHVFVKMVRSRISESLGEHGWLFQLTPDTYLLIVEEECPNGDSSACVRSLLDAFDMPISMEGLELPVHIRCGTAHRTDRNENAETLLSHARIALAALNHLNQPGAMLYDEDITNQIKRYYHILKAFPQALAAGELFLVYQPVVDILTSQIVGVEALSRWNHPVLGFISPVEFIPIIEHNHLEEMLGRYVVHNAVAFLKRLDIATDHPFSVSINIGSAELQNSGFVQNLVDELEVQGIGHGRLTVEITESSLMTDMELANYVLSHLRREGIRVAIDDFGTGFSSLSYLKNLKMDTLKIDRSFIKDFPGKDDGSLLKAIVSIARELQVRTIAEGAETEPQVEFLKQIGCRYCQGYYYAKPLEERRFVEQYGAQLRAP